jgi:hypothetical protein
MKYYRSSGRNLYSYLFNLINQLSKFIIKINLYIRNNMANIQDFIIFLLKFIYDPFINHVIEFILSTE